jgi:predicted RNA-binding protein with PUA-like domain
MKSEPDSFGIADLERVGTEPWSGVRNYMARNFMRDGMRVGDEVLFYHSNVAPPGVAGLARVHRTGVVDQTQFDEKSKYYDPTSKPDDPRWIMVDVSFVERFADVVSLDELRETPGLGEMLVLRKGQRLSVLPVTADEYKIVVKLGRGKKAPPAEVAKAAKPTPKAPAKAKRPPKAKRQAKPKAKSARGA